MKIPEHILNEMIDIYGLDNLIISGGIGVSVGTLTFMIVLAILHRNK